MNADNDILNKALKVSIPDYLLSEGKEPVSNRGDDSYLYFSPIRGKENEKNPSFSVVYDHKKGKWYWKDFGSLDNMAGDILDLVKLMKRVTTGEAISILTNGDFDTEGKNNNSLSLMGATSHPDEPKIKIVNVQPLQNSNLIEYLTIERKISFRVASRYVQECYYYSYPEQTRPYYAIYFKNDKGGAELRNGYKSEKHPDGIKLSVSPKTISTIQKTNSGLLSLYEGFTDFLSTVEHFKALPCGTVIILNSVENIEHVYSLLPQYDRISLFFDNDIAGEAATIKIRTRHPKTTDFRPILYPNHKDVNQFLISNHKFQKR